MPVLRSERSKEGGARKGYFVHYAHDPTIVGACGRRIQELLHCQGRTVSDARLSAMASAFQSLTQWMEEQKFESMLEAAEMHFGSKYLQTAIKGHSDQAAIILDTLLLGESGDLAASFGHSLAFKSCTLKVQFVQCCTN